jgi:hypothetical protein
MIGDRIDWSNESAKGSLMKKTTIIVLIAICGIAGFLFYDWHVKTKKLAAEPNITMYSWTDEDGNKHYTDTQPPLNARDVEEFKGYEHIEPPLIFKIKDKSSDFFKWVKGKLFKKKRHKDKKIMNSKNV